MISVHVNEKWIKGEIYLLPEGHTTLAGITWDIQDSRYILRDGVGRSVVIDSPKPVDKLTPLYASKSRGLGDTLAKTISTATFGLIKPCGGCIKRKEWLNSLVAYDWTWAVGITTAPRKKPTLAQTLESLAAAGWENPHVFAEPGVASLSNCIWHPNETRLGAWPNFINAARFLAQQDCHAVMLIQDDVLFAPGLRPYLESVPWPAGGALSPYTSALYTREGWGWRKISYNGLVGALCFVMRPFLLQELLIDPVAEQQDQKGIDTLFGRWIEKHGGLMFHQPSLCQHIGDTSTIHPKASNSNNRRSNAFLNFDLTDLVRPPVESKEPQIGLIGWNTASGLGSCNRDAVRNLPITRWFAPKHPRFPSLDPVSSDCDMLIANRHDQNALYKFLIGLDAVLFFELPYCKNLVETAASWKIRTVAVAMAECLPSGAKGWPKRCTVLTCPTKDCYRQIKPATKNCVYLPWPVDTERFTFRQRSVCNRFLFPQGTGGGDDRKGGKIVAEAASLAPEIPIVVYSQMRDPSMSIKYGHTDWPAHVTIHQGTVEDAATIYDAGDVSLHPSRYEGLGLPLLEAQACGLPIVATDGPPMNEYAPFQLIPRTTRRTKVQRPTIAYDASPQGLVNILRNVYQTDISAASIAAREFVERERSWAVRRDEIMNLLLG